MQYWASIGPPAFRWRADSGTRLHAGCKDSHHENNEYEYATGVPTKSDSDVIFCLQLLRKTLTCT